MVKSLLVESTAVPSKTGTGRWKAVLITPGQGSSGYYSEDVLRTYGPIALRKGAKSFVTHNRHENGEPDPFQMWGFLTEDAHYEEGVGLVGEIEVLPSWRERVEEVAPHVALSVYVAGETDGDGNVISFVEDAQNGVDMVVYPGRPGSSLVEQMLESARADSEKLGVTSARKEERKLEMEKDVEERFAALETLLNRLVTEKQAAEAEAAQAEADEKAIEARLDGYDAAIDAIEAAELPAEAAKSLREQARKGVDVTPLIEFAKTVKTEAVKSLQENAGHGGRVITATEYTGPTAWGNR